MGCDGGTIPRRDELVRLKKKAEQKDKDAEREFRWLHCALTQQRLQEPIVMCGLGRLYSKQSVIEQLLEKEKMPESCKHIKGIRDIKDLNLTPNPAFKDGNKTGGSLDTRGAPYICKLMSIEMSGKFRFIALWTCGCVFSERAMKQIKTKNCPLCQAPYGIEDVIVLNGSEDDMEMMQAKIEMRSSKKKSSKKSKNKVETVTSTTSTTPTESTSTDVSSSTDVTDPKPTTSSNPEKSAVATKNRHLASKRPMNGKSLEDPEIKRLKEDYSVAKDPKATNVYKSLFTTHKSEKEQNRAHWVTYNPFYN